jgi:hypothetical protein
VDVTGSEERGPADDVELRHAWCSNEQASEVVHVAGRPVPLRDGPLLRTLQQAAKPLQQAAKPLQQAAKLTMKNGLERCSWGGAATKLMLAAETGNKGDIEDATKQIELALFMENRLDFDRTHLRNGSTSKHQAGSE